MDIVCQGKGGEWALLPECSHHKDEVLNDGLHVPDLLLMLCPGGIVDAEDVASDAAHLRGVLGGGGLFHVATTVFDLGSERHWKLK